MAYIVVENEAQKEMILKKQKQVMSGNKSLDLSDDIQSMSEPDFIQSMLKLLVKINHIKALSTLFEFCELRLFYYFRFINTIVKH